MQKQKVAFDFISQQFQLYSATKTLKNGHNMVSWSYTGKEFHGNIKVNLLTECTDQNLTVVYLVHADKAS